MDHCDSRLTCLKCTWHAPKRAHDAPEPRILAGVGRECWPAEPPKGETTSLGNRVAASGRPEIVVGINNKEPNRQRQTHTQTQTHKHEPGASTPFQDTGGKGCVQAARFALLGRGRDWRASGHYNRRAATVLLRRNADLSAPGGIRGLDLRSWELGINSGATHHPPLAAVFRGPSRSCGRLIRLE